MGVECGAANCEYFQKDGAVDFDAFLGGVRGMLSAARSATVAASFAKFDPAGCGYVNASDLRCNFNCSAHPKVIAGEITEDEAFLEFLANFSDKDNSGQISACEWNDFYSAVSSDIDNDQHFCDMMNQAWNL